MPNDERNTNHAYLYTGGQTGWQTIAFTNTEERDSFVSEMTVSGFSATAELPEMLHRTTTDAFGRPYYPERNPA